MITFVDLSPDLLFRIINPGPVYTSTSRYDYERGQAVKNVQNVSLVCKSLNVICGHFIFRKYNLDLRLGSYLPYGKKIYPKNSIYDTWDEDTIKIRLAHLQSKASYVRELSISDFGEERKYGNEPDASKPKPFPEAFIPELLGTFRTLRNLTAVHLRTTSSSAEGGVKIAPALWTWVLEVDPTSFFLDGHFSFSEVDALQPIKNLNMLGIKAYHESMVSFVDAHRPKAISLKYGYNKYFPYKPNYPELEAISVEIDVLYMEPQEPLFDFSQVPKASVSVNITCHVEYKMHILNAWVSTKRKLPELFAEDLSGFDVSRSDTEVLVSRSTEEAWSPSYQDHLQGKEYEEEEKAAMDAYYAMRSRQRGFPFSS